MKEKQSYYVTQGVARDGVEKVYYLWSRSKPTSYAIFSAYSLDEMDRYVSKMNTKEKHLPVKEYIFN